MRCQSVYTMQVNDLSFWYEKNQPIFKEVNFSLKCGEILTILGPNGSGKSTLLNCLAGLQKPTAGSIIIEGERIDNLAPREIACKMGYVSQLQDSIHHYKVLDYVLMGRAPHLNFLKLPGKKDYDLVEAILADLHISHLADKFYTKLSGGERQQVQIARVLVQKSKIILLDEPTNHLDYGNQLQILQLVNDLAKSGHTVIVTTHMPDHAILLGGKIGIMWSQGSFRTGKTESLDEKLLRKLYNTDLHLVYIKDLGRKVCISGGIR